MQPRAQGATARSNAILLAGEVVSGDCHTILFNTQRMREFPIRSMVAGGNSVVCSDSQEMTVTSRPIHREAEQWRAQGVLIEHPRWWHERELQGPLADAISGEVPREMIASAAHHLLATRGKAIAAMPASARLTSRRVRAPLRIPRDRGGLGSRAE